MELATLSPYVRVAWDSTLYPPRFIRERVIYDYELLYLKSGELEITVEDQVYQGKPGDIFFFRPKQRHSIRLVGDTPVRQPHIHFDFTEDSFSSSIQVSYKRLEEMCEDDYVLFRPDIVDEFYPNFPSLIRLKSPQVIETLLFNLINEFSNRLMFSEISVKGQFLLLWAQLLRELRWQDGSANQNAQFLASRIKSYLDQNLEREVNLDELAQEIHLSKYHLCRQFKLAFGCSPIQYHLISRLNKSKEMLQYSDDSISNIAAQFGFQSIYSYSRAFKKHEGVAPSAYRR